MVVRVQALLKHVMPIVITAIREHIKIFVSLGVIDAAAL